MLRLNTSGRRVTDGRCAAAALHQSVKQGQRSTSWTCSTAGGARIAERGDGRRNELIAATAELRSVASAYWQKGCCGVYDEEGCCRLLSVAGGDSSGCLVADVHLKRRTFCAIRCTGRHRSLVVAGQ